MSTAMLHSAQRIAAVLHARGREAAPNEVAKWIEKMCGKFEVTHPNVDHDSFADALADAIEDGQKMWTMCLHLEFGDAL